MDVFYVKWTSGLPLFQRTRGILRTFAVALRDAEAWDTSPISGVSILLSKPGEDKLSSALGDLAGVAGVAQIDGATQNWNAILEAELRFARLSQDQVPALSNRKIEQGVIATFVQSQPPGNHHAKTTDLMAMIGSGKPDGIALEKGLLGWEGRSWYLDETHLDSAEKRSDGTRGLPKTWRLGNQPNLKQMHDDARLNRVAKSAVDDMLTDEIKKANYLTSGADAMGAKVHKLPLDPKEVPSDGEFRFVLLGPGGQSESGKPSSLAIRFCEDGAGPESPRSAKNAILLAVPDRSGLAVAQEKIRDHLAWVDVKAQLASQVVDPLRSSKLDTEVTRSKRDISDAIRQAFCIVVTRGADDAVHAFKVTVDPTKSLFASIKEDAKSRIKDITLAPELLLPGGDYDLWREDEPRRRVKTIIGAFAERSSLPKMLRRKDLLETVANGCQQGLFVLAIKRPDGTTRTWWRTTVDDMTLLDDNLEAIQNTAAELDDIDPSLLVPGTLEGINWDAGVKVSDLVAYFSGHVVSVVHDEENWTEEKVIPRCPEGKVLDAVSAAVANGSLWITSGPASVWGEVPATGVVSKAATLRAPPESVDVSSLTPEALPDAWTAGRTNALAIGQALANLRGVTALPWKLIVTAVSGAMSSGFLRLIPGAVTWPCQQHEAGAAEFGVPEVGKQTPTEPFPKGTGGTGGPHPTHQPKSVFRVAVLDSSQLAELVEKTEEIFGAAGSLTVRFRVSVEFGDGEQPSADVDKNLSEVLRKVSGDFH